MASISCQSLTAKLSVDVVWERLQRVEDFVAQRPEPKIIVFDELDVLAPRRADHPSFLQLSTWAMDFLDLRDSQLVNSLIIGITNNPGNVDPAVIDRLPCTLYFALPDMQTVTAILEHEKIPQAVVVAEILWSAVRSNRHWLTARGAYKAATVNIVNNVP